MGWGPPLGQWEIDAPTPLAVALVYGVGLDGVFQLSHPRSRKTIRADRTIAWSGVSLSPVMPCPLGVKVLSSLI